MIIDQLVRYYFVEWVWRSLIIVITVQVKITIEEETSTRIFVVMYYLNFRKNIFSNWPCSKDVLVFFVVTNSIDDLKKNYFVDEQNSQ